jgi:hypothetical protein
MKQQQQQEQLWLDSIKRSIFLESVHPYSFDTESAKRFATTVFAYDYNSLDKFFYVLLDTGLKYRPVYSFNYFFNWVRRKRRRYRFYYWPDLVFLLDPGYRQGNLFSSSPLFVGYFPVDFFNFTAFNNNLDKFS